MQHLSRNAHGISHVYTAWVRVPVLQDTGHCSSISIYLYEPPSTPILFVAPCQHVLGRVPLFPLFQDRIGRARNATSSILYKYRQHQRAKFPHGSTDSESSRPTQQAGGGAMCTRWTCGFGNLVGASLSLGGFRWQTHRTVELSSRKTVLGVLLRRASAALRGRVQSDLALKKAGCAKIYHVYPILIWQPQR